jgi:ATP-dependent DNA ligase
MLFNALAVRPPVAPMLARLSRDLPLGDYVYEPKWDGFRAIAFRNGDEIEIQSRHERPFARYFPDVVRAFRGLEHPQLVVDGEILVHRGGSFDFETLMLRTHPAASRVGDLAATNPATFVAFDLLADDSGSLVALPFGERRERLEQLGLSGDHVRLTPATDDPELAARWLHRQRTAGIDGVIAKDRRAPYEPGRRSMIKVKLERTVDCVVAGLRVFPDGGVASLLLGLYDGNRRLRHVGVCAAFSGRRRKELADELHARVVALGRHPWSAGFGLERSPIGRLKGAAGRWEPGMTLDWIPIDPLVAEISYTAVDGQRFRHPAQFRRWRPDREPASCTFEQLA